MCSLYARQCLLSPAPALVPTRSFASQPFRRPASLDSFVPLDASLCWAAVLPEPFAEYTLYVQCNNDGNGDSRRGCIVVEH